MTRDDTCRCGGTGWIERDDATAERCAACRDRDRSRRRAQRLERALPRRFRDVSFHSPEVTDLRASVPGVVTQVERYCARIAEHVAAGRGLWLCGPKGTGKTTLGYLVAKEAAAAGVPVASRNLATLLREIRDTFEPGSRVRTSDLLDALMEVDLLHLEDLRVVRPTDWVLEQLYLLVNTRYEEGRPIVFTTDLPTRQPRRDEPLEVSANDPVVPLHLAVYELMDRIGERTVSRLMEMVGDPLLVHGPDHRMVHRPEHELV